MVYCVHFTIIPIFHIKTWCFLGINLNISCAVTVNVTQSVQMYLVYKGLVYNIFPVYTL